MATPIFFPDIIYFERTVSVVVLCYSSSFRQENPARNHFAILACSRAQRSALRRFLMVLWLTFSILSSINICQVYSPFEVLLLWLQHKLISTEAVQLFSKLLRAPRALVEVWSLLLSGFKLTHSGVVRASTC